MIPCPNCGVIFRLNEFLGREGLSCKACKKITAIAYFPALFQPFEKGVVAEKIIEESEASCYRHQDKKAVASCSSCGIYICSLCEITKDDKKICSNCFNKNLTNNNVDDLTREYVQYSAISSSVLVLSVLIWFFSIITAPFVIFYSIKNFNKKEGFFRGIRKVHSIINIIIAILMCIGWLTFITLIILEVV